MKRNPLSHYARQVLSCAHHNRKKSNKKTWPSVFSCCYKGNAACWLGEHESQRNRSDLNVIKTTLTVNRYLFCTYIDPRFERFEFPSCAESKTAYWLTEEWWHFCSVGSPKTHQTTLCSQWKLTFVLRFLRLYYIKCITVYKLNLSALLNHFSDA